MLAIERNGKHFFVDEGAHREWWLKTYPIWELETSAFMDKYCNPEKVTLDIGSWNGVHAMYLAQMSKKVFTLEPDPTAFRILQANLACNPELPVTALQLAVSDFNGAIKIMDGGGSGSSILPGVQHTHPEISTVAVSCRTFRQFLTDNAIGLDDIGFIKMDIEGAEGICIPSMEWFLQGYQGAINLSLHPGFISQLDIDNIIYIMNKYFVRVSVEGWIRKS